uniref:MYB family transcription factor n=1 Tax=Melilotus albus TaxID=47082 RepID=A0A896W1I4_MELAB|nr:MYB family transcription factor [Melilotus albus]
MHGKKEQEHVRKGPWKTEEDEVLLHHVKKYGPRDWSSIRSKGLLQRTGKSCRLRWVNKLRPNLKNGCKFTIEEERIVIELQEQFGNKWAKIASYLPGRTDNDVKNFWSSRQKRLARLLKTSSSTNSKSHKNKTKVSSHVPTSEVPYKFSSSSEGETSSMPQSCSLPCNENSDQVIKMVPLLDLKKSEQPCFDAKYVEEDFTPFNQSYNTTEHVAFPRIPELQTDLTFPMERFDELNLFDVFGPLDASEFGMVHFFEPFGICKIDNFSGNIDSFFDDFPEDMFDNIDPPTSPSNKL